MRFVFLAAAWLFLIAMPAAAAPTFPPLTGRVVDDAGILSDDTKAQLTSMLAQQEKQTGDQVVVVTLKSLQGYDIEDYGYQLGRYWGIGQKGKNNGAHPDHRAQRAQDAHRSGLRPRRPADRRAIETHHRRDHHALFQARRL